MQPRNVVSPYVVNRQLDAKTGNAKPTVAEATLNRTWIEPQEEREDAPSDYFFQCSGSDTSFNTTVRLATQWTPITYVVVAHSETKGKQSQTSISVPKTEFGRLSVSKKEAGIHQRSSVNCAPCTSESIV